MNASCVVGPTHSGGRVAAALLPVVILLACDGTDVVLTNAEIISVPYGLWSMDGVAIPVDASDFMGITGHLVQGLINLHPDGRWDLEFTFQVNESVVTAEDSGTFTVTPSAPGLRCVEYPCSISFVSPTRSFNGFHAWSALTVILEDHELYLVDQRV